MNHLKKIISLLLCACMLLSAAALAENVAPAADPATDTNATAADTTAPAAASELKSEDVLATINELPITWGDIEAGYNSLIGSYGSYYDMTDVANVNLFRAVALENRITEMLLQQKAKELGLDQLSAEEIATAEKSADEDWNNALESYLGYYHSDLTAESSEEDKAAAQAEAVKYYNDAGYTPDSLKEDYKRYAIYGKVEAMATQDAVVTDEEIEKAYQDLLAEDKAKYQNDITAYVEYNSTVDQMAMYAAMNGAQDSGMDHAWYKPAGFRAVKHILLKVDDALLAAYTDLQARLEEQLNSEASEVQSGESEASVATEEPAADATAAPEPTATPAPVTQADVDNAKAAILESLAAKIDEINQKIADGADFDELIATYAVDADGKPTDPGMASEPYKTSGYEVAQASTNYVAPFVEAAFSVEKIGDVSAPYISDFGVHIVKYIADVAEGPIAMTDAQREGKRATLLASRKSELYSKQMEQWMTEVTIAYTGVIPSIAEIEATQAADEATSDAVEEADAAVMVDATEAPAAEATEAPKN
ncbi:MAG: peptidylprolyl isomerase [Clostridia bacterium]